MAEPDQEWIESLLRKRETLQKDFAAYQAQYKRDLDAIDVLLSSELNGPRTTAPVRMSTRRRILDQQKSIAQQEEQVRQDETRRERQHRQMIENRKRIVRGAEQPKTSSSEKPAPDATPAVPIVVDDDANTREMVSAVLSAMGAPMRMVEVVEVVQGMSTNSISADTIRSVLQRMVHSGEARRTERGTYEFIAKTDGDEYVDDLLKGIRGLDETEADKG